MSIIALLLTFFSLTEFVQAATLPDVLNSSFSFPWNAILVGILTGLLVLHGAQRMAGGVIGKALFFIGTGILFTVIALFPLTASFLNLYIILEFQGALMILGYLFIGLGVNKLLKGIR